MGYTLEECDEKIWEYWQASVRTDEPGQRIILRDYIDYWLDIRIEIEGRVAHEGGAVLS